VLPFPLFAQVVELAGRIGARRERSGVPRDEVVDALELDPARTRGAHDDVVVGFEAALPQDLDGDRQLILAGQLRHALPLSCSSKGYQAQSACSTASSIALRTPRALATDSSNS